MGNEEVKETFRDNFRDGPDLNYWTLKRSEEGRVSSGVWEGKNALRVDILPGDKKEGTSERNEISEREEVMVPEGNEVIYKFAFYLSKDFTVDGNRLVFAQWKQMTGGNESPFLSFRCIDGELRFLVVAGEDRIKFPKEKQEKEWRGEWHDASVQYSIHQGRGIAIASVDGESICNYESTLGIKRDGGDTYFKMGLYRDAVNYSQAVYLADFQREILL